MHATQNVDHFGPLLVTVARRWRLELDHQLATAGLSDATWGPLFHLSGAKHPMTQKELAAAIGIDGSTLVRLLDSLESHALLERQNDPIDRRTRRIVITSAGKTLVARIRKALRKPEAQMLEGLHPTDLATMVAGFERIQSNLLQLQAQRNGSDAD